MLRSKKKRDTATVPFKGFSNEDALMGKRMIGGKWTSAEVFAKQKLVDFMEEMARGEDTAKFYFKNLARARAIIPSEDRIRLLRSIAGRKGVIFKVGEKPTEEELMHQIYGTPLSKKFKQGELKL